MSGAALSMDIPLWVALLFVWIYHYEWRCSFYGYSITSGASLFIDISLWVALLFLWI